MSLRKTSKRGHGSMNELNITPLLDLVFVLLVIFIITTPQLMNNLEINLPSPKPPPPQKEKPKINRIAVNDRSQISLNDEVVTLGQLKDKLAGLQANNPDLAVVVKGDDNVPYQVMVNILDTLQDLNIQKVGMATE